MQRIDTVDGIFHEGNAAAGQKGTKVKATWLTSFQEELAAVVEGAGVELDPEKNDQMYEVLASGKLQGVIYAKAYPTLTEADAAAVAAGKQLVITTQWAIAVAQTLNSNVKVLPGGSFTGGALNLLGTFEAGRHQVFFGGCSVVFGSGCIKEAYPEQWGAYNNATNGAATTTAINAALVSLRASVKTVAGMTTSAAKIPLVLMGNGKYLVGGSLVAQDYMDIQGNDSIIMTSAAYPFDQTFPIFTGSSYQNRFTGITFFGGSDQIRLNAGVVSNEIKVTDCQFKQYSGWGIVGYTPEGAVSTSGHATHLTITRPVFEPHSGMATAGMVHVAYDFVSIVDGESSYVSGPAGFVNYGRLYLDGFYIGAPGTDGPAGQVWVKNYGPVLVLTKMRFAGETGARPLVETWASNRSDTETFIIMRDNQVTTSSGNPAVIFHDLPDNFIYENNMGSLDMAPFKYAADIPAETRKNAGTLFRNVKRNAQGSEFGSIDSTQDSITLLHTELAENRPTDVGTSTILASQLIVNKLASLMGWSSTSAGMTPGTSVDMFGEATLSVVGVNSFTNTAIALGDLTGFAAGVYTLAVNISVVGNPVKCSLYGAGSRRLIHLGPGNHTVNHQFYFNGVDLAAVQIRFDNVDAATTVDFSGYRLFTGRVNVNTWNDILYSAAMPATGTYKKGDIVYKTGWAVGSPTMYIRMITGDAHVLGADWGRVGQIY